MEKMKTIFKKNPENMSLVTREKDPSCDWVFNGEGEPHRKYDGTCCMIKDYILYKRRTVKKNKKLPNDFIKMDYDPNTGKYFGWVPVVIAEDKFHMEAYERLTDKTNGTYELLGPKIQGNIEGFVKHKLINHKDTPIYIDIPLDFYGMREYLRPENIEGIVFHHPDGRKAKIRKTDFGLKR
ncbi:MAG: hypothetical protein GY714_18345 [Desulfobacterales bacterium]|nr:hypothetical protein [Desulfobacterales bacterium]